MTTTFVQSILDEFAASIGMTSLEFDEQACCELVVNQSQLVILRDDSENQRFTLIAALDLKDPSELSASEIKVLLQHALNPLNSNRPGIGWHEEMGFVAYHYLSTNQLSLQNFQSDFVEFIDWLESDILKTSELENVAGESDHAQAMFLMNKV